MAIWSAEAVTLCWPMADFIRPGTSSAKLAVVPKVRHGHGVRRDVQGDPLVEAVDLGLADKGRSTQKLADLGEVCIAGLDQQRLEVPTSRRLRAGSAVVVGQHLGRGARVGKPDRRTTRIVHP